MLTWLQQCFNGISPLVVFMGISLLVGTALVLRILWLVQRTANGLDFSDWLRGADGKASWSKAAAIGGWMVGSFCMIHVTLTGKVPDGYWLLFLTYFAIVIGNPAAIELVKQRVGPAPPPPTTVSVTSPPGQTTQVQTGPTPPPEP